MLLEWSLFFAHIYTVSICSMQWSDDPQEKLTTKTPPHLSSGTHFNPIPHPVNPGLRAITMTFLQTVHMMTMICFNQSWLLSNVLRRWRIFAWAYESLSSSKVSVCVVGFCTFVCFPCNCVVCCVETFFVCLVNFVVSRTCRSQLHLFWSPFVPWCSNISAPYASPLVCQVLFF